MKRTPIKPWLVLTTVLMSGVVAFAQSSNGVPGPEDYDKFSRFVTDRNIFDPNRQPHNYGSRSTYHTTHIRSHGTPGIQFVGTMSYEKGMFAFFNGNTTELSKVVQVGDKIQGYMVTDIAANTVGLQSADKQEKIAVNIGDGLREENNKWVFSKAGEMPLPAAASSSETTGSSSSDSNSSNTSSTPATPPSANEQNDTLKRLMQQREKENQ
jgi:hypothetical protein